MAEEHEIQSPEGHRLCVNNCGFFGSPATQNMCSKCYRDLGLENSGDSSLFSASLAVAAKPIAALVPSTDKSETPMAVEVAAADEPPQQAGTSRCPTCRKKVGLTGFRCRCGATFCGVHRYPEKHGCTFDFKSMGREAIARANPLIKADKLERI